MIQIMAYLPSLIVICGPTATGKTSLALALAVDLPAVILSADSRACYRDFDLGTAKPSRADQQRVPHALLDICDPRETLTLATYQDLAQGVIRRCHDQGQLPFLVGGTGLYIRSVTAGLQIPRVPPQPQLRSQLQALGLAQLYAYLRQIDPGTTIHPHDLGRILRSLEVGYVTGQPLSQHQGKAPPPYPILKLGLDCLGPGALERRIARRTEEMLQAGLVEEAQHLRQHYGDQLPLWQTLGYREVLRYLQGEISLSEAHAQILTATRQLAKRQRTWFRGEPDLQWLDSDDPDLVTKAKALVEDFLLGGRAVVWPGVVS